MDDVKKQIATANARVTAYVEQVRLGAAQGDEGERHGSSATVSAVGGVARSEKDLKGPRHEQSDGESDYSDEEEDEEEDEGDYGSGSNQDDY